jgi:methyl-accepting chemotaxis protein
MKNSRLIENAFNLRFGLKFSLLTIAGMMAVTIFLFFVTAENMGDTYTHAVSTIYDLKIRIFPLMFASFYSIGILAVVTMAIALITVFFSHKIAGPIYRIEKSFEQVGSGDLTVKTRLREHDQLAPLAEDVNGMVQSLNLTLRASSSALAEIKRCGKDLEALLGAQSSPSDREISGAMGALKFGIDELKRVSSDLKTPSKNGK